MVRLVLLEVGTGLLAVAVLAFFFAPALLAAGIGILGLVVTAFGFRSKADRD